MEIADLLLTSTRQSQLETALANTGVPNPLETCIAEAEADVARLTTGYSLDELSTRGFTRAIALFRAYSLAGPVPEDVTKQYQDAMRELEAIAKGERPNLARESSSPQAAWGSETKIS